MAFPFPHFLTERLTISISLLVFVTSFSTNVFSQGLLDRPENATCLAPDKPEAEYELEEVFEDIDFTSPIYMVQAESGSNRWYVAERAGQIIAFANDDHADSSDTVLDLSDITRFTSGPDSQQYGVTSFALHPLFPVQPYIYIAYNAKPGADENVNSRVSRFASTDGGATFDIESEDVLISVEQTSSWHHMGTVSFGPGGYLYASIGENGSMDLNRAQDLTDLRGSILRIDVDSGSPFSIPADNPLVGTGFREEIYAWGLRNPWRFSFDRLTGELYVGDVGPNKNEEVNIVTRGSNYGWNNVIGEECRIPGTCNPLSYEPPLVVLDHSIVQAIIGGFVYRGSDLPSLQGSYLLGNGAGFTVRAVQYDNEGAPYQTALFDAPIKIHSMAESIDGEIYMFQSYGGKIYKLVPTDEQNNEPFPQWLSETGCFDSSNPTQAVSGVIPYRVNNKLWSDGAEKARWMGIPDGTTVALTADGDFSFPVGSVVLKQFSFEGAPIETRILALHDDGSWGAYTYAWNDEKTDAVLVSDAGLSKVLDNGQTWVYPSKEQCFACHTTVADTVLGIETLQQNGNMLYPSSGITANQLETLEHIGYFSAALPAPVSEIGKLFAITDETASLQDRARSYLHSNCSGCHRPGSEVPTAWDARFTTLLGDMEVCLVRPGHGDVGASDPYLVNPGDSNNSVIALRINTLDGDRMPPIGTSIVDSAATSLINSWINQLGNCMTIISQTVYEDGEDGTIDGWVITDNDPPGSVISNIYDPTRGSRIISLQGNGKQNGYELSLGNNGSEFVAQWSGRFTEVHTVVWTVDTAAGIRRIMYAPATVDTLPPDLPNIEYGLGPGILDGNWHTFTRDLQADLHVAQPGVDIIAVRSIKLNGSGELDDISLIAAEIESDDEPGPNDEVIEGWSIVDNDPPGASITAYFDAERGHDIVLLSGQDKLNRFEYDLGVENQEFTALWTSKFDSAFTVLFELETTQGLHRLKYLPVDYDTPGSGENVSYGLGLDADDGTWRTWYRDLQVDLEAARPGAQILAVNAFKVIGSGVIDGVELIGDITEGWVVIDDDPVGADIDGAYDEDRGKDVVVFSGDGKLNAYLFEFADNSTNFIAQWAMNFSEAFTLVIEIETSDGLRRLIYRPVDYNELNGTKNIKIGLGSDSRTGDWIDITRDLEADLQLAYPDVNLLSVNSLTVKGSGSMDGPVLSDVWKTLYDDAEDGTIDGWQVVDNIPAEALITNEYDDQTESRVIVTSGDGKDNSYQFEFGDNDFQFAVQWDGRYTEAFSMVFIVETSGGRRRLIYYNSDTSPLGTGENISIGLGSDKIDYQWRTFTRNLEADLKLAQPDIDLQSVTSLKVNGDISIDNLTLLSNKHMIPMPPGC